MTVDATEADWETEYLSVDSMCASLPTLTRRSHIRRYSSGHTEGIVASDVAVVRAFRSGIDASGIAVNADPLHGRWPLGLRRGGYLTQKLHARGPMGPRS